MEKICAVIVTYNRKEYLVRCINSILEQTKDINKILIIDNNSTDGTKEFLLSKGYLSNKIINYIKLDENIGGAGGFNRGMKIAYEEGYDWVWVMDDDGIPDFKCLEMLLNAYNQTKVKYIAPLVVNIDNEKELSFGLYLDKVKRIIKSRDYFKENGIIYVYGSANPFNGILIHRDIISKIGLPKEDMFIWGDEVEYLLRVKKYGFKILTCINAIHKHPKDRQNVKKTFMGLGKVAITNNKFRDYIKLRNHAFIRSRYNSKISLIKYFILHSYYYLITDKFNFQGLTLFWRAFLDGINNNFSRHKQYMK